MRMVDIHNHLIYKFDDGPQTLEECLEMLKIAIDQGITDVFATSHFNELIPQEIEDEYFEKLNILRSEALSRNLNIFIYSGSEIFFHHFIDKTIKKGKVTTLANLGQYSLMEFPLFMMPNGIEEALFKLSMEHIIPIIAHPERYQSVLEKPQRVYSFIKYGGLLQVNAGSVLGEFGKDVQKIAMWLLEDKLVHFIGSDAHTTKGRTFKMQEVSKYLKKYLDADYLRDILEWNGRNIIHEVKMDPVSLPENGQQSQGILKKFRKKFRSGS